MATLSRTVKQVKPEEPEDFIEKPRYPSPPPHLTHVSRGVFAPSFSSFHPKDLKFTPQYHVWHVAWSCDGRRLASAGIDRSIRLWTPDKSLDPRSASQHTGGHEHEADHVAWNPTHPDLFCSSSQRDRRIVFWDARQSRSVQTYTHSYGPTQVNYGPDGKTICFVTTNNQLNFLSLQEKENAKPQWGNVTSSPLAASCALFNHAGDGLALSHYRQNSIMIVDYPSFRVKEQAPAHVSGCSTMALDPRGCYLASGGHDSIVDLFDVSEWICIRTITACDHSVNSLSFSHDGEYIAISSQGSYVDICAVETGLPLHRINTLGPIPSVAWHPSKYVLAYCGTQVREGGQQVAFVSLFGPGLL